MVAVEEEMVEEAEAEGKLIYHLESSASFFRTTSGLTPLSASVFYILLLFLCFY
jgi:hypothetical protein